jgi:hypothetical protein
MAAAGRDSFDSRGNCRRFPPAKLPEYGKYRIRSPPRPSYQ